MSQSELLIAHTLDEIVHVVTQVSRVFVRYSAGPEADGACRSMDYESGLELPGLSVAVLTPEPWWTRPTEDWVARRLCKYDELLDEDRFPWLLTGDIVGRGPDHEPLVRMRQPLGRVGGQALAEARHLYEARFEVGKNSRSTGS
jgi:hypothetical protein